MPNPYIRAVNSGFEDAKGLLGDYFRDVFSGKIAREGLLGGGLAHIGRTMRQNPQEGIGLAIEELIPGGGFLTTGKKAISGLLGELPMDEASRMARAREMGFDTDQTWYHGTADDVPEFDRAKFGGSTRAKSAKAGVWVTDDPRTARSYAEFSANVAPIQRKIEEANKAERLQDWDLYDQKLLEAEELERQIQQNYGQGQNIMPLVTRGDFLERDMTGAEFMDVQGEINDIIRQAKHDKFDGVKLTNLSDDAGFNNRHAAHTLIFDPKNLRSKSAAAFDPAKKDSANLLAALGLPVAATGLLAPFFYDDDSI